MVNGSSREYNLTGLAENSDFSLWIRAQNRAGSNYSNVIMARTSTAGILNVTSLYIDIDNILHVHNVAPSSPPQDLAIFSTSSTSITISWGDIPCEDKNSDGITYQVVVTSSSDNRMTGITSNTNFTACDLTPGTNYTFEVSAASGELHGPTDTIEESTKGKLLKFVSYSFSV